MQQLPYIAAIFVIGGIASAAVVAVDLRQCRQPMRIMNSVWILTCLWASFFGLAAYYAFGRVRRCTLEEKEERPQARGGAAEGAGDSGGTAGMQGNSLPANMAGMRMEGMEHPGTHAMRADMPGMEHPGTRAMRADMPGMEHAGSHAMQADMPGMEHPGTRAMRADMPGMEHPGTHAMRADMPGMEHPETHAMRADMPGMEHPGTHAMQADMPGMEHPGTHAMRADMPGMEHPGTHAMRADMPGMEHAGTHAMRADMPGMEHPETHAMQADMPAMRMEAMAMPARPGWQSVVLSTLHCGAGCTLADLLGEWFLFFVPVAIGGSMLAGSWVIDYLLALVFGIGFQYAAIRGMEPRTPRAEIVRRAAKADMLSLTAWQAGMYGWMAVAIFVLDGGTMLPRTTFQFWFMMQIAMACGFLLSLPVNVWLIRAGIKKGM